MATIELNGADEATVGPIREALKAAAKNNAALTGAPTAPTADPGTNTTQLATTAFVTAAVAAGGGGGSAPTIATQAEAEAGTDNTKMMTPLRTAQAIAELASSGGGGGSGAPLDSPEFTGTPTAPVAAAHETSNQIAVCTWVMNEIADRPTFTQQTAAIDAFGEAVVGTLTMYATLESPALTGTPTAPTAALGTSTTQLATTAFVNSAIVGEAAIPATYRGTWSDTRADFGSTVFEEVDASLLPATGNPIDPAYPVFRAPVATLPAGWSGSPIEYYWITRYEYSAIWNIEYSTVAAPGTREGFGSPKSDGDTPAGAYGSDFVVAEETAEIPPVGGVLKEQASQLALVLSDGEVAWDVSQGRFATYEADPSLAADLVLSNIPIGEFNLLVDNPNGTALNMPSGTLVDTNYSTAYDDPSGFEGITIYHFRSFGDGRLLVSITKSYADPDAI